VVLILNKNGESTPITKELGWCWSSTRTERASPITVPQNPSSPYSNPAALSTMSYGATCLNF
jgi:hypothetical protein